MKQFQFKLSKIFKSMTIRRRFALSVLVVVVFIMSLSGIMRIINTSEDINNRMKNKVDTITELAALSFSDPLWNYSDEGMRAIGGALFKDRDIGLVVVTTNKGREVYKEQKEDTIYKNINLIVIAKEIVKNDVVLGVVTIGLTSYYNESALQKEIINTIFSISVTVLILWMLISFISNMLTKPIYELSEGTEEIARGNLAKRININYNDEIGGLAQKFNEMAKNLHNMMGELECKNTSLETEINERKQAQSALATSEEKFFKAFRYVDDVIGIIRLSDKQYIEINDAFSRVLGYDREEVIGHASDEFCLWFDMEERAKAYELLKKERSYRDIETIFNTKSGEKRVGLNAAEIIEIQGENCIVFVWHDITERKHAEEALRKAYDQLEIRIQERTATLARVNQALQGEISERKYAEELLGQKNQEIEEAYAELKNTQFQVIQQEKLAGIGQLAAGVAHEINNPLGFVSSNMDSLSKYLPAMSELIRQYQSFKDMVKNKESGIEEKLEGIKQLEKSKKIDIILDDVMDLLNESKEGLDRINKIVISLRTFTRIDQQAEFREYNLKQELQNILLLARNEIKYHAEITLDFQEISSIQAIGGYINQVLLNIIMNAVQAIKTKDMKEMGTIEIKAWQEGKHVFCSIRDNGIGIKENYLKKIFDAFFTTKAVGEGTGLGLSISYDIIVNKHGGELFVDSKEGEGTIFTIKLPVEQREMLLY